MTQSSMQTCTKKAKTSSLVGIPMGVGVCTQIQLLVLNKTLLLYCTNIVNKYLETCGERSISHLTGQIKTCISFNKEIDMIFIS
jgi:hypothetical protein